MATATKEVLSGSTDGQAITIAATGSPGTTIHTADASLADEIWLFACNTDTSDRKLTIEFGDADIEITIPAESGLIPIVPGLLLTGSKVVRGFAATASVIEVFGFVNRITN